MYKKRVLIFIVVLSMLLTALACEISFGGTSEDEIAAQLTLQALQQTQTAMAKPAEPEEEAPPPDESEPEEAADEEEEEKEAEKGGGTGTTRHSSAEDRARVYERIYKSRKVHRGTTEET